MLDRRSARTASARRRRRRRARRRGPAPSSRVDAEADGGVALRVDVDEQRLVAGLGDAGGDVDGGGGLADPALLVRDGVDGAHAAPTLAAGAADSAPNGRSRARIGCELMREISRRRAAVSSPFPRAAGSAPAWARPCGTRAASGRARPRYGTHARAPRPARARACAAAAAPSASSAASTAPFQRTSTPPSAQQRRRVLAQHRQRRQRAGGDDVAARRRPSAHSSARAWTTVAFASPAASAARSR